MKPLSSHSYNLREIPALRGWNAKTFYIPGRTKDRTVFVGNERKSLYFGEVLTEFHVRPIHYVGLDKKWHDLNEIASYFGNKNGMTLKEGWESRVEFAYLIWYLQRQKLIGGKGIRIGVEQGANLRRLELPFLVNTTSTFYPDADPESATVDGIAGYSGGQDTWANVRDTTGNFSRDSAGGGDSINNLTAGTSTDNWTTILRGIFLFDTASIPDTDVISAATLSFDGTSKSDGLSAAPTIQVYEHNGTASATSLTGTDGDITLFGTGTAFSSAITYANWSTSVYNDFALNASGIASINNAGISYFGCVNANYDAANTPATWSSSASYDIGCNFAETALTTQDPKLVVTHAAPASDTAGSVMLSHLAIN